MKSNFQNSNKQPSQIARRGSTLVIVIALLGIMAFLGLTFYTFAKQEKGNATTFALSAQTTKAPSLEPDALFDFALLQIILGPPDTNTQSILWGGRHSMLANMFGRDGVPWNGEGVNLIQDQSTQTSSQPNTFLGQPRVDLDFDGLFASLNDNQTLLYAFVDSPAANANTTANPNTWTYANSNATWSSFVDSNSGTYNSNVTYHKIFRGNTGTGSTNSYIPEPDVNYNAPDINTLFLSYDGTGFGLSGTNQGTPLYPTRVIIPSYFRPQYLRTGSASGANWLANWYNASNPNQIMRPHPGHVCVDSGGNTLQYSAGGNIPRFVSSTEIDTSTTPNRPLYQSLGLRRPFTYGQFAPDDAPNQPSSGYLGVWTPPIQLVDQLGADNNDLIGNPGTGTFPGVQQVQYHLDVDTDGDGIKDAILMDLGYPPVRRGDGKLVIPLFAISIRDLNGLLNINADGNLSGNINLTGTTTGLSAINKGSSPPSSTTTQFGFRTNVGLTSETASANYNSPNYSVYAPDNLSKSNMGLSTNETNLSRALTADPSYNSTLVAYNDPTLAGSEAAKQLSYFLQMYDNSITTSTFPRPGRSIVELANLEWFLLNVGRPNFHLGLAPTVANLTNAITDIFTGRYGEPNQVLSSNPPAGTALPDSVPISTFRASSIASYNTTTSPATANIGSGTGTSPAGLTQFLSSGSVTDLPKPGFSNTWYTPSAPGSVSTPIATPTTTVIGNPALAPSGNYLDPDDNVNPIEGEPNSTSNARWVNPLDFRGTGQFFQRFSWGVDGAPGTVNVDDDQNGVYDDVSEEGWPGTDDIPPNNLNNGMPPQIINYYPFSYGKTPNLTNLSNNSLFFPVYSGYHSFFNSSYNTLTNSYNNPFFASTQGGVRWGDQLTTPKYFSVIPSASSNPASSLLMRNPVWNSLLDDPAETIIDPAIMSPAYLNYLNYLVSTYVGPLYQGIPQAYATGLVNTIANDSVFGPEETLFLQGTAQDARISDGRSRLAELMPANLVASQAAPDIRKRLTTVSSDRREFGSVLSPIGGNSTAATGGSLRSWESIPVFPPFGPTGTVNGIAYNMNGAPDPYRAELFYYLQQQPLNGVINTGSPSLKLNVNRWLFLDAVTGNQYGFAPLPQQTSATDVTATLARQNMCRDIYTLLYTLCHVHSNSAANMDLDYRTVATTNVPSWAQAKEMAQFAVNLVDALDPDDISTAFYYDPDLSYNKDNNANNSAAGGKLTNAVGWDNAAYKGPDNISQTADDFVVYGVERQYLAFTEYAALNVTKTGKNDNYYLFDDSAAANGHMYLFFELQNVSPMNVTLASSTAVSPTTAQWRVRLTSTDETTTYNTVYFLSGLDQANNFLTPDPNNAGQYMMVPGQTFSVSSQDGNDVDSGGALRTSDYRAFLGSGMPTGTNSDAYSLIIPQVSADGVTVAPDIVNPPALAKSMTPRCNLDLAWNYGTNSPNPPKATQYQFANGTNFISGMAGKATNCRLILERLGAAGQDPNDPSASWNKSVWVPVDKTSNPYPNATTNSTDLQIQAITSTTPSTNLTSYPRALPLVRTSVPTAPPDGNLNTFNVSSNVTVTTPTAGSVGALNNANSLVWQLQFDRDFASLSELFQIPLYGPDMLTAAMASPILATVSGGATAITIKPGTPTPPKAPAQVQLSVSNSEFYASLLNPDGSNQTGAGAKVTYYYPATAGARFLRPDNPDYVILNNQSMASPNPFPNNPLTTNPYFPIMNNTTSAGASGTTLPVNNGNRWYRLLNMLEVPNRNHQHQAILGAPPLGNPTWPQGTGGVNDPTYADTTVNTYGTPISWLPSSPVPGTAGIPGATTYSATNSVFQGSFSLPQYFGWPRTHGLLNLNMIRHPQVLLALIDDDQLIYDPRYYRAPNNLPLSAAGMLPNYYSPSGASPLPPYPNVTSVSPYLDDATQDPSARQWWVEFIKSRDSRYYPSDPNTGSATASGQFGPDPIAKDINGNYLYVPGTANSRPFRGLDFVGPQTFVNSTVAGNQPATTQDSPLENTILRALPIDTLLNNDNNSNDGPPNESRRLLEIGNNQQGSFQVTDSRDGSTHTIVTAVQEHFGQITSEINPNGANVATTATPLHPYSRYRLMSKLMNNTTTRTNSYAVYITVQYYEAAQVSGVNANGNASTATRIGGLLDDAPVHRGFFVIDRTGALDQMKTLATNANTANNVTPGTFYKAGTNLEAFPVSAASYSFQANTDTTGQRPNQNGIRWKDLILYRRTLN